MTNARRRGGMLAALLLAAAVVAHAEGAPADCPPALQAPTSQQLQAAQQAARDRGFLWRVSKGGRSSWLYGTVHLGKLDWVFPGRAVREAMAATDTLALELDLTDPAVALAVAGSAAGRGDALALPPALRDRLARRVAAACLAPGAIDAMHPLMRAFTLSVLEARWVGLDAGYAQELVLAGAARATGVPVVSLESVQVQLDALIPADRAAALEMLTQMIEQLESGVARRVLAQLAEIWSQGRFDDLEQYERWCDCATTDDDRAFLKRLNDDRNPGLAERIDALHTAGQRTFAAVGALHMTGPQALPALMARRGYQVERIAFAAPAPTAGVAAAR